jgi:mediator of RNA polymerase II transcription subunit 24
LEENGNTFFEKWVRDCMVERNKTKSPLNAVRQCDQTKVDELIMCLTKDGLKNTTLKWHEVCANIPGLLYQVLLAWENESLSNAEVKLILDSLRVRMCAFSVCAASWLCAYMQIVKQDELLKPMNMVQQLLKMLSADEMSEQENFKER